MPSSLRIAPDAASAEPMREPAPIGPEPLPPALLLTCGDLARELRDSGTTVTRMDQRGLLPRPVKIGRAKRYVRSTIVAWIAAGCPRRAEWEAFFEPARGKRR